MKGALQAALAVVYLLAAAAGAVDSERLSDPALQRRYEALLDQYTCKGCDNTSLADGRASLAGEVRREIRFMIRDGATDADVRAYLERQFSGRVLPRRGPVMLWGLATALTIASLLGYLAATRQSATPPTGN